MELLRGFGTAPAAGTSPTENSQSPIRRESSSAPSPPNLGRTLEETKRELERRFHRRTRLPIKDFGCAWFDGRGCFEFFPLHAVRHLDREVIYPLLTGIVIGGGDG